RSNEENARIARKYEKSAVNRPASESVARVPSDRAIDYQQRDDIDFSGLDAIGSSDEDADLFERYDGSEVDYEQYEAGGNHAGGHIAGAAASNRSESGGYSSYDEYAQDHAANYGIQRGVLVNARTGDVYHLENDNILIGREESCDISIPDASISRAHARMSLDNMGSWTITDLNSTNGTSVNGHKVDDAKLHFGDQITLGTTILLFQKG
ncbi:MAG: FHA domain-containing protein, partial [Coriobacteriales bacterium]